MRDDLLTIVTPTRDRPDLLALYLRSVFQAEPYPPPVIVSDNRLSSTVAQLPPGCPIARSSRE
jgi:hypothetical protein